MIEMHTTHHLRVLQQQPEVAKSKQREGALDRE